MELIIADVREPSVETDGHEPPKSRARSGGGKR
jgi:hypothetical protein